MTESDPSTVVSGAVCFSEELDRLSADRGSDAAPAAASLRNRLAGIAWSNASSNRGLPAVNLKTSNAWMGTPQRAETKGRAR